MTEENEEIQTDEIQVEEIPAGNTRDCDECGKEYKFKSRKSQFCSDRCRGLHRRRLNGNVHDDNGGDDSDDEKPKQRSSTQLVASLKGIDVQSQYIITHQRDIIDDLKTKRDRLEKKLETITTERNDLSKKLDRIELETSLGVAAKSGLNGIAENPLILKLADHLGPSLGAWITSIVEKKSSSGQLTGMDQLPAETQQQLMEISAWYSKQSPEVQTGVWGVLNVFAEAANEDDLKKLLIRVNNLLKNGSTVTSSKQFTGTFN